MTTTPAKIETPATAIKAFIRKAKKDGRTNDAAWGAGYLDGIEGRMAADGASQGSGYRHYLAGWCKANGI